MSSGYAVPPNIDWGLHTTIRSDLEPDPRVLALEGQIATLARQVLELQLELSDLKIQVVATAFDAD